MTSHQQVDELCGSIQQVKGVGPRTAARFKNKNIHTVADALFFLPARYEVLKLVASIAELVPGELMCFSARVLDVRLRGNGYRKNILELVLGDASGTLEARWFNFDPKIALRRFSRGDRVRVSGRVEVYKNKQQMIHPEIEKIVLGKSECIQLPTVLVSCYPEIDGINPKSLRKIMRRVVEEYAEKAKDILPRDLRLRYGFPSLSDALYQLHLPLPESDLNELLLRRTPAHRRLIFEEFFLFQLCLALSQRMRKREAGFKMEVHDDLESLACTLFGFELTRAQKRVLLEIIRDLHSNRPMNRLLQGDVGSGKTALALLAALVTIRSNAQTALMAPTEILAEQHLHNIVGMLDKTPDCLKVAFLSSSVKSSRRKEVLDRVASGELDLLVGTHAMLEDPIVFRRLGLCIIDEQHRFGVLQRARMRQKGTNPHVLIMTATPIPRTLAMTIYGDLDVSKLDELPPGRKPVKTFVLKQDASQAYWHIRNEVKSGNQAYLVYPLVDESAKMDLLDATRMFQKLQEENLANLRLGLLHGRMSSEIKEQTMSDFAAGKLDVLVSTTIVEVGMDVPRATTMVVEHAERFGLSQLHQLRGRVGRGKHPGTCFLVAHCSASQDAQSRLDIMERTNDGFVIAERDMAIRGPGEYMGTRQSGIPSFLFADLIRDADLLSLARKEAFAIVTKDQLLSRSENASLRQAVWSKWGKRLRFAEMI